MIPSDANSRQHDRRDSDERLAPVTYLFGAKPTDQVPLASEGHEPAAISPTHPVFRDETPVAAVRVRNGVPDAARRAHADRASGVISDGDISEIAVSDGAKKRDRGSFDRVSNVSMYALARRGMSSQEMRDYLIGREFDAAAVDEEVERLEGVGLLDDESLAETLVRTLRDRKGLGRSALTAELRRRNVDGDAIEEAMGSLDDDELERAIAIAIKRAPQLRSLDTATAKRRLGAFLMRKGYSGSVISTAVQRALAPAGPTFH